MQMTRVAKAKVTARAPDISLVSPFNTVQSMKIYCLLLEHIVSVNTNGYCVLSQAT